jgi:hypothetical protein
MWVSDRPPNVEDAYNTHLQQWTSKKDNGFALKLNTWITNPHHKESIILKKILQKNLKWNRFFRKKRYKEFRL